MPLTDRPGPGSTTSAPFTVTVPDSEDGSSGPFRRRFSRAMPESRLGSAIWLASASGALPSMDRLALSKLCAKVPETVACVPPGALIRVSTCHGPLPEPPSVPLAVARPGSCGTITPRLFSATS